jgi:GDP-mannose 6-dehydrogenase
MNISIVGLGYVGAVSAACLANRGHRVWGVDISKPKVDALNAGRAPAVEPGLEEAVQRSLMVGKLTATCSMDEALRESDICLVAVATPSTRAGGIDSTHLLRACRQIGSVLRTLDKPQVVAIRSSVLPSVIAEAQELFDAVAPGLVDLCVNPEFLREGTAIRDFEAPPYTVIGTTSANAEQMLRSVYAEMPAPVYVLPPKEAAMVKYASNAFHGAKVAFANEIGAVSRALGIDAAAVMEVFCSDTKLNISRRYLRPGFAFGGSCLPKDLRAIVYAAKMLDIDLPMLRGVLESNGSVLQRALHQIIEHGSHRIGLIGLSFKPDTDDLRESPFVDLAERLLGKGFDLRIYDPNVSVARLVGANRDYIERTIPHLSALLVPTLEEVIEGRELVVIGHHFPGVDKLLEESAPLSVLDLSNPRLPAPQSVPVAPEAA